MFSGLQACAGHRLSELWKLRQVVVSNSMTADNKPQMITSCMHTEICANTVCLCPAPPPLHDQCLSQLQLKPPRRNKQLNQHQTLEHVAVPQFIVILGQLFTAALHVSAHIFIFYNPVRSLLVRQTLGQQLPGSRRQWGWHMWGGFQSLFPGGQTGCLRGRCRSEPDSSVQSGGRKTRSEFNTSLKHRKWLKHASL